MANKKSKQEGKIINKADENPVDVILRDEDKIEEDLHVKMVEAESKVHLEDDKGEGEVITLRFFEFVVNPQKAKELRDKKIPFPTAQELFNSHLKQINLELWKDEWQVIPEIEPRLLFSKDLTHYRIIIGAKPAKGSLLSITQTPKTLSELAHPHVSIQDS